MQLEFASIPPYLCAQWWINNDSDGVGEMIKEIVVLEMFHFALAGAFTQGLHRLMLPDM